MLPDLISRMGGRDPVIKVHLIGLVSKFDKPEVNHALEMQLKDANKMVRSAALQRAGNARSRGQYRGSRANCCKTPTSTCKTKPST